MRTASHGKNIYSVDMLIAYINHFKLKATSISMNDDIITSTINVKGWTENFKTFYSIQNVLDNPKKYKTEYKRIKHADLRYPIIIANGEIMDGFHRVAKSMLEEKSRIKINIIPSRVLRKCLLNSQGKHESVRKMEVFDIITLFIKRFKLTS